MLAISRLVTRMDCGLGTVEVDQRRESPAVREVIVRPVDPAP